MYTKATVEASHAELLDALEISRRLDDADFQLRALWGLCVNRLNSGLFQEAMTHANEFCAVASTVPGKPDLPIGDRMLAMAQHYMGDQSAARIHFERMLNRYSAPAHRSHTIRFLLDQRVSARAVLAEVLWLQGFPDQAMRAVEHNIVEAVRGRPCAHALQRAGQGLPGGAVRGRPGSRRTLRDDAAGSRGPQRARLMAGGGAVLRQRAHDPAYRRPAGGERAGCRARGTARDPFRPALHRTAGELAELLGRAGAAEQGLGAIDEAIARTEANGERWCLAELLRIRGELLLLQDAPTARQAAEDHFLRSLEWAREQRVLAWELRASMSLARLWKAQRRTLEAREQLAQVLGRYTEGHGSADLRAAADLLEALD